MIPNSIKTECSQYLNLLPTPDSWLMKPMKSNTGMSSKIKIRHKKVKAEYEAEINNVFSSEHQKLLQRCLIAYTSNKSLNLNDDMTLYYVFPINGFKFMYNPIIDYSLQQYDDLLDKLNDMGSSKRDIFYNTIKLSFKSDSLIEANQNSCEIIFYNIPYYYAIQKEYFENFMDG